MLIQNLWLVFQKSGQNLVGLLPYVLGGVLVGEVLKLTSWTKLIYRGVSQAPFRAIFLAASLGMLSPLCTYGTIPVVLLLYRAGVDLSPLITFLATSALMNPQLFVITWGGLGLELAMVRVGAVFLFGLGLGLLLYKLPRRWVANPDIVVSPEGGAEILQRPPKVFQGKEFFSGIFESLQFVGFYLIIGLVIGAAIEVFVPATWIGSLFNTGQWWSVFLASLMGVPLYACGGGVVPLVQAFIEQGMSKGAALAFLLVGPATRAAPLMALATILRPRFILMYVSLLVVFSVGVGLLYH